MISESALPLGVGDRREYRHLCFQIGFVGARCLERADPRTTDEHPWYTTDLMTLSIPVDIAGRGNCVETVLGVLNSIQVPVISHVFDGRCAEHRISSDEFKSTAERVAECSIAYVLSSASRGMHQPIAGLISNENLGIATLQYLIDDESPAPDASIPRRTTDMLGVYIRTLFEDSNWLQSVCVPADVSHLDGMFGLTVGPNETSVVSLRDLSHRPESARRWP